MPTYQFFHQHKHSKKINKDFSLGENVTDVISGAIYEADPTGIVIKNFPVFGSKILDRPKSQSLTLDVD